LYDDGGFSGGTMDRQVGGRVSKTQYRHTLTDADQNELNHWSAIFLDKLKSIPEITDVTSDQENGGPRLNARVNRDILPRASGFCPQPWTTHSAMPSASVSTIYSPLNQ
jgi:multidrug efflux pump